MLLAAVVVLSIRFESDPQEDGGLAAMLIMGVLLFVIPVGVAIYLSLLGSPHPRWQRSLKLAPDWENQNGSGHLDGQLGRSRRLAKSYENSARYCLA